MRSSLRRSSIVRMLLAFAVCAASASAQSALPGYTLFNPNGSRTTFLVDMQGRAVKTWQHALPGGYAVYLLPNGNLLRPATLVNAPLRGAASSGLIQEVDWNGTVVWQYQYSSTTYIAHHDIEPMPNGNVLLIAWEVKSAAQATALGRVNAAVMWPDHIVEIKPVRPNGGEIVWRWHAWDHLVQDRDPAKPNYGVISEHPGRFDINLRGSGVGGGGGDWMHVNGISYDPVRDLIAISSHFFNEVYVIDHSTTIAEAAGSTGGRHGKGGDILYRWGKAANYGLQQPAVFDVVHCAWWVPSGFPGAGRLMAFNNNAARRQSVIVELDLPLDQDGRFVRDAGQPFGPAAPVWSYSNGSVFFSNHLGGVQRLSNGNTFITEATSGYLFEVSPAGQLVWEYQHSGEIARALRYPSGYPGLSALNPTPLDTPPSAGTLSLAAFPNPVLGHATVRVDGVPAGGGRVVITDALGRTVRSFTADASPAGASYLRWDARDDRGVRVAGGMYRCTLQAGTTTRSITLLVH